VSDATDGRGLDPELHQELRRRGVIVRRTDGGDAVRWTFRAAVLRRAAVGAGLIVAGAIAWRVSEGMPLEHRALGGLIVLAGICFALAVPETLAICDASGWRTVRVRRLLATRWPLVRRATTLGSANLRIEDRSRDGRLTLQLVGESRTVVLCRLTSWYRWTGQDTTAAIASRLADALAADAAALWGPPSP
jgi:hypothetical protein